MSALTDEAGEWRKTALPPEPWGDDHIVLRLAAEVDSLTAQLQKAEAMIAEALSYFEDGSPEGAARLLRRVDTSALAAVKAEALREAAIVFAEYSTNTTEETMPSGDRYVTTEAWLRARAASIEQEGAGS